VFPEQEGKVKRFIVTIFPLVVLCLMAGILGAQSTDLTNMTSEVTSPATAIGYLVNAGSTKVDFKGTDLSPQASGEAKVEAKPGVTQINAKVEDLPQPGRIAPEFLTYVLWAVTPDGRTNNLGEILIDEDGKGSLKVTTQLQTFSLIVTNEPYHSVRLPSELVVLKNDPRSDTKGTIVSVDKYRLMKRNQYEQHGGAIATTSDISKTVPLQMYEARNAVAIAKARGAEKYAPEIFRKASSSLSQAESLLQGDADKKEIISAARQTVQYSEDSRLLATEKQEELRIANERQMAADAARTQAEANAAANAEKVRQELLAQLSQVLETRDTPRGIVVNMADVLFDTGRYDLRPEAREKLAKLAGILQVHPGLQVEVEGHTDSTGSAELNQTLSEQRAEAVATYLIEQGVSRSNVKAMGLGEDDPVADNSTVHGRQKNRRVEIIISGEVIGNAVGGRSSIKP